MATPLTTPTRDELNFFYPISESIPDTKREELKNYVANHIFIKMFGYEAMVSILSGEVPDSASNKFLGFQKLLALCCSYEQIKDPLVSTNFGAKIISRDNVISPSNEQKRITLQDIEDTISIHLRAAYEVLSVSKCSGSLPTWSGYFSYKMTRL